MNYIMEMSTLGSDGVLQCESLLPKQKQDSNQSAKYALTIGYQTDSCLYLQHQEAFK